MLRIYQLVFFTRGKHKFLSLFLFNIILEVLVRAIGWEKNKKALKRKRGKIVFVYRWQDLIFKNLIRKTGCPHANNKIGSVS
jgi:hypothetical protein